MANAGAGTTGSQFFLAWTDERARRTSAGPPYLYSILGRSRRASTSSRRWMTFAPAAGDGAPTQPLYIFKVTIPES